jgi:hypothetical protein
MRLSDIMSALELGFYAEVALVLFMAAFFAIGLHVFLRRNASLWERARHLPLDTPLGVEPPSSLTATADEAASPSRGR